MFFTTYKIWKFMCVNRNQVSVWISLGVLWKVEVQSKKVLTFETSYFYTKQKRCRLQWEEMNLLFCNLHLISFTFHTVGGLSRVKRGDFFFVPLTRICPSTKRNNHKVRVRNGTKTPWGLRCFSWTIKFYVRILFVLCVYIFFCVLFIE